MDDAAVTVLTWNLQGALGLDVGRVAGVIAAADADVVAVQEIQRRQAAQLASALGMAHRWARKHTSPWTRSEGLAVLTPHRLVGSESFLLRNRPPWDWRRRIAVDAVIDRDGARVRVIDIHLSAYDAGPHRRREAERVLARAGGEPPPIIAGDFNDEPGDPGYTVFVEAGWQDAWQAAGSNSGDGATNWTSGARRGRPPTQRLDYVLAPPGWSVDDARVLADAERLDWFAELSDHLPLVARLRRP